MRIHLEAFSLRNAPDWLDSDRRSFRPCRWPPTQDWVVSEREDGTVVSRYGGPSWDFSELVGHSCRFDFEWGLTEVNGDILRLLVAWLLWGPRSPGTFRTVRNGAYSELRKLLVFCSEKGIVATDLWKHPRLAREISKVFSASSYASTMAMLHGLWDARADLGIVLLDQTAIKRLVELAPAHEGIQTPYIPPRIWTYQLQRLRACLDDFNDHRERVKACYNYCLDAYERNFGSLAELFDGTVAKRWNSERVPFQDRPASGGAPDCVYHGTFASVAEQFGIVELLERWTRASGTQHSLVTFAGYLGLVEFAGTAYITNFTLQRCEEAMSLRSNCLEFDEDEALGRVPIIIGETTKTVVDSDARWPASPSVEVAVSALTSLAQARMRCRIADCRIAPSEDDQRNPYLNDRAPEPWVGGSPAKAYRIRPKPLQYAAAVERYPKLFDREELRITAEDLRIARMLTPNLTAADGFEAGKIWPLAWHQLRRTGAVNMFASGYVSDITMQLLMKHASRIMPLYYGRGYGNLRLNSEVGKTVIMTMYEMLGVKLLAARQDCFVSPHGAERKDGLLVKLIGEKNAKQLASAGARGETTYRAIRLGACLRNGPCEYGGMESVAHCGGGDGGKPCSDALFDRRKESEIRIDVASIKRGISKIPKDSPRRKAQSAELRAMENYLDVIS